MGFEQALGAQVQLTKKVLAHGVHTDAGTSTRAHVPEKYFHDCCGVVVVTQHAVALVVGGVHGSGLVMKKLNKGSPLETWSAPVPFTITGAQFGVSIGWAKTEFILFLTSHDQVEAFEHHAQVDLTTSAVGAADTRDHAAGGVASRVDVMIAGKGTNSRGRAGVSSTGAVFANASGAMLSAAIGGSVLALDTERLHSAYGANATAKSVLNGHVGMEAAHGDNEMKDIYKLLG
ncbi:SH3 domain-containing protein [Porphyridium purpureum]|nr:SH3 domain-containing protein [Porphyridium purpureum]|eukprot:POR0294..scf250_33